MINLAPANHSRHHRESGCADRVAYDHRKEVDVRRNMNPRKRRRIIEFCDQKEVDDVEHRVRKEANSEQEPLLEYHGQERAFEDGI